MALTAIGFEASLLRLLKFCGIKLMHEHDKAFHLVQLLLSMHNKAIHSSTAATLFDTLCECFTVFLVIAGVLKVVIEVDQKAFVSDLARNARVTSCIAIAASIILNVGMVLFRTGVLCKPSNNVFSNNQNTQSKKVVQVGLLNL